MSETPPPAAALPPGWFARQLHRNYSRGAALNFFFSRRIRPAGVGLLIVIVLTAGLGFGHPQMRTVYQIFSLSFGMALIAVPWAFSRRAKLHATRELPRYATVGESVRYTIRVTNTGARPLRRAWIAETLLDPRPTAAEFARRREPGEEDRNLFDRTFAYYRWQWLLAGKRTFEGGSSADVLDLEPGTSMRVFTEITPLRRGVIRLNDLRVLLPDPFSLVQTARKVPAPAATVTVLPRRYLLPTLEMPGSSRFQTGDQTATNAIGNSGEFVGLRDYRPGDPLRQIHWKSWARTGRPIVKELEDTYYPRYALVLDTFLTESNSQLFEDAVSVAASFIAMIDRGESLLDLMFIKDEAHVVTAGRGLARTEKLLEVLAGVEGDQTPNFEDLGRLVLRHRDELTSCLVILAGWDETRAEFLKSLARGGIACAPVVIGEGEKPADFPGHWLESGHIARDLLALPRRLKTNL
jgi:uncharacterized protein (DUF58 family)